ncbi:hypothetical protein ACWGH7_05660 [Streptomyces cyaneofuscatus]|uniref:hypothetical protein n=1 Tax=Streptomyces TaxID=1883 RepID=UPI000978FC29|nr:MULTISPECIES: hypothetical protein [unclassified Streptomyces]ONI54722.1 hypothetical protein STIB_02870 [Streptomyces sp. IB2014 011-1]RDV53036.1 hypothetical protein DDV98_05110 [Streptomyces sp. IB2014 011-12]
MAWWNPRRRRTGDPDDPPMPLRMEGVPDDVWMMMLEEEGMRRQERDHARIRVEAELARPHERAVSHMSIAAMSSTVFGAIALTLLLMGFGWWSLTPVTLMLPAVFSTVYFGLEARRSFGDGTRNG